MPRISEIDASAPQQGYDEQVVDLSKGIAFLSKQMQYVNSIFETTIVPALQETDSSLKGYLDSVKVMDLAIEEQKLTQSSEQSIKFKSWTGLAGNIEIALKEMSLNFSKYLLENQKSMHNKRKIKLDSTKSKIRIYTNNIQAAKASFKETSSKLDAAIKNIKVKTMVIDRTLTKLRNSNNSDMSKALGNTVISRKNMENAQLELMEMLKKKASVSINNYVGKYVDSVGEKGRGHTQP